MKLSQRQKRLIFLCLILLVVVGLITYISLSLKEEKVEEVLEKDPIVKILFVLHDEEKNVINTNVLFYYEKTNYASLLNIPGRTGGIYSSIGRVDRIDVIYKELGIDSYKKEIEKLIGKEIPFTFELSVNNFSMITDFINGLDIFIPNPVDFTDENGNRFLLPSGVVGLDGDKINTYMNFMLPEEKESDVDSRRQDLIIAFFNKMGEKSFKRDEYFSYYKKLFKTNLDEKSFYKVIKMMSNINSQRLTSKVVTGLNRIVDDRVLLFPFYNGQLVKDVVNQTVNTMINGEQQSVSGIYVLSIQNGTTVTGLASNTSKLLQSAGYEVFEATNADHDRYEHTLIIDHIGNAEAAKSLADFILCKNVQVESVRPLEDGLNNVSNVDFTIILGRDFDGRYVKGGYDPSKNEKETK